MRQFYLLFFCILLFGTAAVYLGQDYNWDLLQYHFYNGFAFLHGRIDQDIAPAMIQTYQNPFFDVISYILITLQKPKWAMFLLGTFTGVTCFFLYKISAILFSSFSMYQRAICSIFSIFIGMTGAAGVSLLNTTANDTKLSLLIVIALYCLLEASRSTEKKQIMHVMLSALFVGMASGFKLTGSCYAIGLMDGLFVSTRRHYFLCFIFCIFFAIGFLLADGY